MEEKELIEYIEDFLKLGPSIVIKNNDDYEYMKQMVMNKVKSNNGTRNTPPVQYTPPKIKEDFNLTCQDYVVSIRGNSVYFGIKLAGFISDSSWDTLSEKLKQYHHQYNSIDRYKSFLSKELRKRKIERLLK